MAFENLNFEAAMPMEIVNPNFDTIIQPASDLIPFWTPRGFDEVSGGNVEFVEIESIYYNNGHIGTFPSFFWFIRLKRSLLGGVPGF